MKRTYSFISVLLSIAILLGMQFIVSDDARAADLEFSNIKLEGDVLSWDPIPNLAEYYHISFVAPDGSSSGVGFTYPSSNLGHDLDCLTSAKPGEYEIILTASDTNGNNYKWVGKYNYNRIQLNEITDIEINPASGYLTWQHDTSNAKGIEITYSVEIRVNNERFEIRTTDKKIPIISFAQFGTHRYSVEIWPSGEGCKFGSGATLYQNLTIDEGPVVTGLKIDNDVLSWNAVEGADRYRIYFTFGMKNGGGHISEKIVSGTSYELLPELKSFNAKSPNTIKYSVSAYKGDERISMSGNINYEYEEKEVTIYPIRVMGIALTPNTDINDILKGKGSVSYDSKENKLIFKNFVFSDMNMAAGVDLFQPLRPLTIEGNATININGCAFLSYTDLEFAEGSDITVISETSGVYARDISINGKLTLDCKQGCPLYADGCIELGKASLLKASTPISSTEIGAVYAQYGIELGETKLIAPEGGKLAVSNIAVLDPDGKFAKNVILGNLGLMPTATPKPTATPTAKATGKPTAKPTSATPSKDPKVQILDFVNRIYKYVLNREPEEEGAAYWSDELYSFRRTGAEVAQGFIFSPEFENRKTTDEEFVTILYKTFFGRDPEEEGMNFWLNQLKTGTMDRVTVANGFIYSQEWADTCASYGIRSGGDIKPAGNIEPTALTYAFVERMYTTAMGRTYDEEGRQYWASELANFNITGEQVGAAFFLSDEMTNYKLDDKEYLNRLYKTFMDREAKYWLGVMASGTSRSDVVFGFTRSPEFTDKCVEARILPY